MAIGDSISVSSSPKVVTDDVSVFGIPHYTMHDTKAQSSYACPGIVFLFQTMRGISLETKLTNRQARHACALKEWLGPFAPAAVCIYSTRSNLILYRVQSLMVGSFVLCQGRH